MHEVEVEVFEACGTGHVRCADGFVAVVDAPECLELGGLETLHADGQSIDAELAVIAELGLLEGPGVGFQSDLDAVGEPDQMLQALDDGGQCPGGEQAWRAATEEDRAQPAALDVLEVGPQIRQQRGHIGLFRQLRAGHVGVEVTVRALAHAPGDMDVRRQGRQFEAALAGCRRGACGDHIPSRCLSRAMARARWLSWFFCAAGSSALEQSHSGTQNSGS